MPEPMYKRVTHPMSQEERAKRGDELAKTEQELVAKKAERKEITSELNAAIKTLQAKCEDVSKQITTGTHEEDVEIFEEFDDARKLVTTKYANDVKPPEVRNMTIVEIQAANARAQGSLPFDKAAAKAAARKAKAAEKAAAAGAEESPVVDDNYQPEGAERDISTGAPSEAPPETAELNGQPLVNARKAKKSKDTKINPKRKAPASGRSRKK